MRHVFRPALLLLIAGATACGAREEAPKRKGADAVESTAAPAAAEVKPAAALSLAQIAAQVAAEAKKLHDEEPALLAKLQKSAGPDAKVLKSLYGDPAPRFYDRAGQLGADGQALLELLDIDPEHIRPWKEHKTARRAERPPHGRRRGKNLRPFFQIEIRARPARSANSIHGPVDRRDRLSPLCPDSGRNKNRGGVLRRVKQSVGEESYPVSSFCNGNAAACKA